MKRVESLLSSALLLAAFHGVVIATPPAAPTNLSATGTFVNPMEVSLILTWTDNATDDAGFLIEASENGGQTWSSVAYTPNDFITLHRNQFASTLGWYDRLLPGATRTFRVAATHPTLGLSSYSNQLTVTLPTWSGCGGPHQLSPVPNFTGHVGFPIDLRVYAGKPNTSCSTSYAYCVVSGPLDLTVDFNGGLVSWTPTQAGTYPVTLGFGTGNSSSVCTSTVATTSFTIEVDPSTISQPLFRDYRSEAEEVPILGTVFGTCAFYASKLCPVYPGTDCGLQLVSEGTCGDFQALQGTWDISGLDDGERQLLVMITQDASGKNTGWYDPVILDRTAYNASWPKRLPLGSVRGALAVDVTGDGRDEIIANSRHGVEGGPYVWNLDGTLRWQAPAVSLSITPSEVAVGDVNGDGTNDVVTVATYYLRVFDGSAGTLLASLAVSSPTQFRSGASLADLDGDGKLEVLVTYGDGTTAAHAVAYKLSSGSLVVMPGWPQTMTSTNGSARPSTADLDGDGQLEVVVSNPTTTGGNLYAWHANGTLVFNTTLQASSIASYVNGGAAAAAQPSIADLDGNGTPEIVVGINEVSNTGAWKWCLGASCNTGSFFPASMLSAAIGEFISSYAGPEIVLGRHVFRSSNGNWVRTLGTTAHGPAILADGGLNGQGQPQTYALMGTLGADQFTAGLTSFHADGTVEEHYPKALYGNTGSASAPQVGDFDHDGNADVLVEITDSTYGAIVALYKTDEPFNPANNPWPMSGHDPQRTGRYTCKQQRASCTSNAECCSARCSTTCQ